MKIAIELTAADLKELILGHVQSVMGDVSLTEKDVTIEVKSSQNYRSEWEPAEFRARVTR